MTIYKSHPLVDTHGKAFEHAVSDGVFDEVDTALRPTWFNEDWFDDVCGAIRNVLEPLEDQLYEPTEVRFP